MDTAVIHTQFIRARKHRAIRALKLVSLASLLAFLIAILLLDFLTITFDLLHDLGLLVSIKKKQ